MSKRTSLKERYCLKCCLLRAAWLLNMWVLRRLIQLASSDAASAGTVMGEGRQPCVEALPAGTEAAEGSSSRPRSPRWPGPTIAPSRRCRAERRSGWLPARPGQWQHLLWPPPRSGAVGAPRPPPLPEALRARVPQPGRGRAGGRRCRAWGAGLAAERGGCGGGGVCSSR